MNLTRFSNYPSDSGLGQDRSAAEVVKQGLISRHKPQANIAASVIEEGLIGCAESHCRDQIAVEEDSHFAIGEDHRTQPISIAQVQGEIRVGRPLLASVGLMSLNSQEVLPALVDQCNGTQLPIRLTAALYF